MATLEYKSPDAVPKTVTLEQSEGEVRLIFPPPPRWALLLGIIVSAAATGAYIFGVSFILKFALKWGMPLVAYGWVLLLHCAAAALCLIGTIYTAAHFRRWGRTPTILRLTRNELIWSRPGFWRLSQKKYDVNEIESFDVLPVRDIFGRKTSFKLRCRLKRRRPLVRHLSTRDPELPQQIERAFREVLCLAHERD